MELKDEIESYNKKVKSRMIDFKLGAFIGVDADLHNYSLSEFINIFKIKRMVETGRIDNEIKEKLIHSIRKYNTRSLEVKRCRESLKEAAEERKDAIASLVEKYSQEAEKYKDFLKKFGIDVDVENSINLENIVDYDIYRKSIYFEPSENTKIYSQDKMKELSLQFVARVLKLTNKDKDTRANLRLYNLVKLEFLVDEKYLNPVYKDGVAEMYEISLRENDEAARAELKDGPYNLIFDELDFDFTSFIDYLIKKDARIILGDPKGIYEEKLSGNIR